MGNTESHTTQVTGGNGPNVYLNVYILRENAKTGAYHTGIELCGVEYAYGGGSVTSSGVYQQTPREDPPGDQWTFHQQLDLGKSKISGAKQARDAVLALSDLFPANEYHISQKNCNHFTLSAAKALGTNINYPDYINKLANLGAKFGVGGEFNGTQVEVEAKKTVFESTKGKRLDGGDDTKKTPTPSSDAVRTNPRINPRFQQQTKPTPKAAEKTASVE